MSKLIRSFFETDELKESLTRRFVERAIEKGGWQELLTEKSSSSDMILANVNDRLTRVKNFQEGHEYTDSSQHERVASSESDEEVQDKAPENDFFGRITTR